MKEKSTIIAAFEDRGEAEAAAMEMIDIGISREDVGLVIRGSEATEGGMITDALGTKDRKGAVTGILAGGSIGALIGAAMAFVIPGVGPIIAMGIFTTALGGAMAGSAIGGILGAMVGLGISEEEAKFYETEFRAGRAIVAVKAGQRRFEVTEILRRHGGYDISTRAQSPIPTHGTFSEP
jgi:hypothetical protein